MFSYIVALAAFVLFFYNPILQYLAPATTPTRIHRTPRPQINEDLLALELDNSTVDGCSADAYAVRVFSLQPLVLYIESFLSAEERAHLLAISNPVFEPSTVTHDGGQSTNRDSTVRDSEVALIPRTPAVRCIEARARALQGWRRDVWVERLRVQRYTAGGHYSHHFDWSASRGGWGRVSSFMVWVDDGDGELRGGGTEFPLLKRRSGSESGRWCRFVECGDAVGSSGEGVEETANGADEPGMGIGVIFKPIPGNAVFWENFTPDGTGRGYDETWHAGLPVEKGVKVGLNIWSWGRLD